MLCLDYEQTPRANPHTVALVRWLEANGLDSPDLVSILVAQRITFDNMKYLKDTDLIQMGIREWGSRIALLEAIQVRPCL